MLEISTNSDDLPPCGLHVKFIDGFFGSAEPLPSLSRQARRSQAASGFLRFFVHPVHSVHFVRVHPCPSVSVRARPFFVQPVRTVQKWVFSKKTWKTLIFLRKGCYYRTTPSGKASMEYCSFQICFVFRCPKFGFYF